MDKLIAYLGSVANKIVERQDKRIVETQVPKKTALKMGEKLVAADRPVIEYRRKPNPFPEILANLPSYVILSNCRFS